MILPANLNSKFIYIYNFLNPKFLHNFFDRLKQNMEFYIEIIRLLLRYYDF
jgi:hypothetical protein